MAGRNCHAYTTWPAPFMPIKMNNVRDIEMGEDCDGKIYHDGICCMMSLCQEDDGDVQGFMCMPSWRWPPQDLRLDYSKQDETHGAQVPMQDTRHHLCYARKLGFLPGI
jgi:hypothetical protein